MHNERSYGIAKGTGLPVVLPHVFQRYYPDGIVEVAKKLGKLNGETGRYLESQFYYRSITTR